MFTTNRNQTIADQYVTSVIEHEVFFFIKNSSEKMKGTLTSLNPMVVLTYSWWREEITKTNNERRNMRIT